MISLLGEMDFNNDSVWFYVLVNQNMFFCIILPDIFEPFPAPASPYGLLLSCLQGSTLLKTC